MNRRTANVLAGCVCVLIVATVALVTAARIAYPIAQGYVLTLAESLLMRAAEREAKDIRVAGARLAAEESAAFVLKEMGMAEPCANKMVLFDLALSRVDSKLAGMYCEFGVYKGETINYIASKVQGPVHGFDSFEGLPENWRAGFEAGKFKLEGFPEVRPNVKLYKGWFKDSVPRFLKERPEPVAFAHLDADLYVSTKDVFDALGDRIVAGTVLQFDEFFNYHGWQEGESKAFFEFCKARHVEVEYIGYVPSNEQVAVRIKRIGISGGR